MALNVNNALTLQFGQSLGVEHKVFNCLVNALVGGLNIDDGAQFVFVKDGVVFGFSPPMHTMPWAIASNGFIDGV